MPWASFSMLDGPSRIENDAHGIEKLLLTRFLQNNTQKQRSFFDHFLNKHFYTFSKMGPNRPNGTTVSCEIIIHFPVLTYKLLTIWYYSTSRALANLQQYFHYSVEFVTLVNLKENLKGKKTKNSLKWGERTDTYLASEWLGGNVVGFCSWYGCRGECWWEFGRTGWSTEVDSEGFFRILLSLGRPG